VPLDQDREGAAETQADTVQQIGLCAPAPAFLMWRACLSLLLVS